MDGETSEQGGQAAKSETRRNELGRFEKGTAGGPGRGKSTPNPKRVQYVHATFESVSVQEWKAILAKAKRDALGVKIVAQDGRSVVVDDPESIGIVRSNARIFIRDALIGKPTQAISIEEGDGDAFDDYARYSNAELRAIIAAEAGSSVSELSDDELVRIASGLDVDGGTGNDAAESAG